MGVGTAWDEMSAGEECEEHHPGQQPEPHLPAGHAGDGQVCSRCRHQLGVLEGGVGEGEGRFGKGGGGYSVG